MSGRRDTAARKREVEEKLQSKDYTTVAPDPHLKSIMWKVFRLVVDGGGASITGSGDDHTPPPAKVPQKTQELVLKQCVNMCATDLCSFGTVSGQGFVELAQTLIEVGATHGKVNATDVLPHRTTVSRHTAEEAKKLRDEIMQKVLTKMSEGKTALTTDMWTCAARKNHYMTCTASYFDDWELKSHVLFTTRFPDEPKSGDNIRKELARRFLSIGVAENVLRKSPFTTDQGANIINALSSYTRLNCACPCHMLNTVLRNAFNAQYVSEHSPQIDAAMIETKELVTYVKQSGLVNVLEKTLEQSNDTRWNTRLTMLESVRCQYDSLCDKLYEKNQMHRIDGIDVLLVDELIALLMPFKNASKDMECEKKPSLHLVLPWKMDLLKHLSRNIPDHSEIKLLRARIKRFLEEKLVIHMNHKIATFLWAPFRHLKMLSSEERREVTQKVKQLMEQESNSEEVSSSSSSFASSSSTSTAPSPSPPKRMTFSEWADVNIPSKTSSTDQELEQYLNQDCGVVDDVALYSVLEDERRKAPQTSTHCRKSTLHTSVQFGVRMKFQFGGFCS